ncbi:hypothetical protein KSP39_PZI010211 [Platanthera zijinensis]|uniref:Uncharacterized protein n=1 Tax=Platanthera zijinensis TaxID=2320716 RepID=A0AAP0G6H7_9ASPA
MKLEGECPVKLDQSSVPARRRRCWRGEGRGCRMIVNDVRQALRGAEDWIVSGGAETELRRSRRSRSWEQGAAFNEAAHTRSIIELHVQPVPLAPLSRTEAKALSNVAWDEETGRDRGRVWRGGFGAVGGFGLFAPLEVVRKSTVWWPLRHGFSPRGLLGAQIIIIFFSKRSLFPLANFDLMRISFFLCLARRPNMDAKLRAPRIFCRTPRGAKSGSC